jgi:DNA-binding transcriptional MerR regulator
MPNYLRTTDLARAANIHPNTVRLYEQWGYFSTVERSPKGYRRFTETHLAQLLLARRALRFTWLGGKIRATAGQVIARSAAEDLGGALELAYHLLSLVQAERAQAESAAAYLQRWAEGAHIDAPAHPRRIGDAARLLDVSIDSLRSWEHNGLIEAPRDPANGYRLYGPAEIGRLRVIRMLIRSRYSVMAVLRMLSRLDEANPADLRAALDTPEPEEDVQYATDRWLSALAELENEAQAMIAQIETSLQNAHKPTV